MSPSADRRGSARGRDPLRADLSRAHSPYKTRDGYRLQPANVSYSPIEIKAPPDPDDAPPDFRIVGPVVGVVRMVKQ